MKFRPCIDLHKGKVKQIVGSSLNDNAEELLITNFETEQPASYYASRYRQDNLAGGHVIMLGPGCEAAAKDALAAFPLGLQVGGGITPQNAGEYLDAGASHVIVTSYVFSNGIINWENCSRLVKAVGKEHCVLDLSCTKIENRYVIVTDRWQKLTEVTITRTTLDKLASFCDEFLVHASHVEGKQQGIDEALVELLAELCSIPVTYAGGVRSLRDLDSIHEKGTGKIDVTIGSALDIFGGHLKYADVLEWFAKHKE